MLAIYILSVFAASSSDVNFREIWLMEIHPAMPVRTGLLASVCHEELTIARRIFCHSADWVPAQTKYEFRVPSGDVLHDTPEVTRFWIPERQTWWEAILRHPLDVRCLWFMSGSYYEVLNARHMELGRNSYLDANNGATRDYPQVMTTYRTEQAYVPMPTVRETVSPEVRRNIRQLFLENLSLQTIPSDDVFGSWNVSAVSESEWDLFKIVVPEVGYVVFNDPDDVPESIWIARSGEHWTFVGTDLHPVLVGDLDGDGSSDALFLWSIHRAEGYRLWYKKFSEVVELRWEFG